ncbi:hypothetical protein [Pseudofrankia sp. BMG5.37]|uniref:hypothetical protein n=1 Tax=Pseudofrankia sp. BMG5.37 TaxID=3050035 RepID=UPI0028958CB2|nr:hypothetical protein [Pseudofrankia sp. BMG5.37]MDT3446655.1 hypothetical protein [Pseudofrankia sp. BMG5.37]
MVTDPMRQLPLPGVLVLVSTPSTSAIVADNVGWQRAVAQAGLPPAAKLVALILASHVEPASGADPELPAGSAVCAPGLRVLVTQTKYSRTHVQRQLAQLRKLGWLTSVGRPAAGRPARFVLTLPRDVARSAGVGLATPSEQAKAHDAADVMAATGAPAATADPAEPAYGRLAAVGATEDAADGPTRVGAARQEAPDGVAAIAAADAELAPTAAGAGAGAAVTAGGHLRRRAGGRARPARPAPGERGRARIAGTLMRLGARPSAPGSRMEFTEDVDALPPNVLPDPFSLLTGTVGRRAAPRWSPLPTLPVAPRPTWPASAAGPMAPAGPVAPVAPAGPTASSGAGHGGGSAARDAAGLDAPPTNAGYAGPGDVMPESVASGGVVPADVVPSGISSGSVAGGSPPSAGERAGGPPSVDTKPATASPSDPPAPGEPPVPAEPVIQAPRDPVAEAAAQLVGTLASAMRCEPEVFADCVGQLTDILNEGGWSPPTLATHLVHLVVGGVKVGSDSPADGLTWRLKHLPRTSDECPCGACRSWRTAESEPRAASGPSGADGDGSASAPPGLAEIERAAAVGAEQAALLARARAS